MLIKKTENIAGELRLEMFDKELFWLDVNPNSVNGRNVVQLRQF